MKTNNQPNKLIKLIITTILIGIGSLIFTREKIDLYWGIFALCGSVGITLSILWNPQEKEKIIK